MMVSKRYLSFQPQKKKWGGSHLVLQPIFCLNKKCRATEEEVIVQLKVPNLWKTRVFCRFFLNKKWYVLGAPKRPRSQKMIRDYDL